MFILKDTSLRNAGKSVNKNESSSSSNTKLPSQKEVFDQIKDGVKEGEGKLLMENARKISKKTDTITFSSCNPDILIAQAQINSSIKIKNSGGSDHSFRVSGRTFTVKSGSEYLLKTDFEKGVGIYSIFCDSSKAPSGVLVIAPQKS